MRGEGTLPFGNWSKAGEDCSLVSFNSTSGLSDCKLASAYINFGTTVV